MKNGIHPDLVLRLVINVLNDQDGINEEGYKSVMALRGVDDRIDKVLEKIDGCNNRYFLHEGDPVINIE